MLVLLGGVLGIVHALGGVLASIAAHFHTLDCVGWLK